jgi:hypothetical protein
VGIPMLADIPEKITAGDSVNWKKSFVNFPASEGWTLSYVLTKTGQQITFAGTVDGDAHLIQIAAATSATWEAGEYIFDAYVTKAADRQRVDHGLVEILTNLAAQIDGYNGLPYCFTVRDAIIAVLELRATESQSSIAVGGRQISEMSHAEIQDALTRAEQGCNLWKQRNRRDRGKATGAKVKVAFTD